MIRMDVLKILMYRQDMCTMGARHSKWDVITILPSSSSEAASWEKANICMQLLQALLLSSHKIMRRKNAEQKGCLLIPLTMFSDTHQRYLYPK